MSAAAMGALLATVVAQVGVEGLLLWSEDLRVELKRRVVERCALGIVILVLPVTVDEHVVAGAMFGVVRDD